MTKKSIILLGGPDSGKTNYIGRLWPSFRTRKGVLVADKLPDDIGYVDRAVEHLMQGSFAPRSDRNLEVGRADFAIRVRGTNGTGDLTELMIPDISGELWTKTVATSEISQEWFNVLKEAEGAVVFVRARSDQNVQPLDWVTANNILRLDTSVSTPLSDTVPEHDIELAASAEPAGETVMPSEHMLPTQVLLCELLRYLNLYLADRANNKRPQVSIVVAAWDLLDQKTRESGPMAYLKQEFPLFAGRLTETGRLDVKLFGLSVVGGDLTDDEDFRAQYLQQHISEQGWVVFQDGETLSEDKDVMLPIAWAMGV